MTTVADMVREAYANWDDAGALAKWGRALHDHNRLPVAREVLRRCVDIDPKQVDAWRYLAYTHFRDNDDEGGRRVLKEAFEKSGAPVLKCDLASFSGGDEGKAAWAELEELAEADPVVRAALIGRKVYEGDPKGPIDELKKLRAKHPASADIREQLLWSLLGIGWRGMEGVDFLGDGLPLAEERIAESPASPGGYWAKAQYLTAAKDWDRLLESTAEGLAAFPGEETQMQFRARAYREKGDLARSETWLNRAIGAKPSFAGARIDLGKLLEKQDRFEEAEETFREIATANPDYPAKRMGLAFFLSRRERWDEAETLICEDWEKLPPWITNSLRNNPEYKPLLERPRVAEVIGPAPE